MQDATKFALVNEGRKRYSQSINIKTVGEWLHSDSRPPLSGCRLSSKHAAVAICAANDVCRHCLPDAGKHESLQLLGRQLSIDGAKLLRAVCVAAPGGNAVHTPWQVHCNAIAVL